MVAIRSNLRCAVRRVFAVGITLVLAATAQSLAQTPKLSRAEADNACANYAGAMISNTEDEVAAKIPGWKFKCEHHPEKSVCDDTQTIVRAVRAISPLSCGQPVTEVAPSATKAAIVTLKSELTGANEVPPNNSPGIGSVTAMYETATKTLLWKGTVSGLTGPAIFANFRYGEPGTVGGVLVPISGAGNGTFEGSVILTEEQASDLLAGKWYVNVHTSANKAGEIRGQLLVSSRE